MKSYAVKLSDLISVSEMDFVQDAFTESQSLAEALCFIRLLL